MPFYLQPPIDIEKAYFNDEVSNNIYHLCSLDFFRIVIRASSSSQPCHHTNESICLHINVRITISTEISNSNLQLEKDHYIKWNYLLLEMNI